MMLCTHFAFSILHFAFIILILDKMAYCHFIVPQGWHAAYSGKKPY